MDSTHFCKVLIVKWLSRQSLKLVFRVRTPVRTFDKPVYPSQVKGGALKMLCVMLRGFESHCWYIFYLKTTDIRFFPGLIACT